MRRRLVHNKHGVGGKQRKKGTIGSVPLRRDAGKQSKVRGFHRMLAYREMLGSHVNLCLGCVRLSASPSVCPSVVTMLCPGGAHTRSSVGFTPQHRVVGLLLASHHNHVNELHLTSQLTASSSPRETSELQHNHYLSRSKPLCMEWVISRWDFLVIWGPKKGMLWPRCPMMPNLSPHLHCIQTDLTAFYWILNLQSYEELHHLWHWGTWDVGRLVTGWWAWWP